MKKLILFESVYVDKMNHVFISEFLLFKSQTSGKCALMNKLHIPRLLGYGEVIQTSPQWPVKSHTPELLFAIFEMTDNKGTEERQNVQRRWKPFSSTLTGEVYVLI